MSLSGLPVTPGLSWGGLIDLNLVSIVEREGKQMRSKHDF